MEDERAPLAHRLAIGSGSGFDGARDAFFTKEHFLLASLHERGGLVSQARRLILQLLGLFPGSPRKQYSSAHARSGGEQNPYSRSDTDTGQ